MTKKLFMLLFVAVMLVSFAFLNCPTTASDSSGGGGSTASSTSSTSSAGGSTVNHDLYINFQTLASGLTENTETTIAETVLPTVRNASNLAVYLEGKLKMNTTQALPAGSPADATLGCVQFSNNTTSVGKVKIKGVKGPFYLKIYQTSANASEVRNLRVTIDGTEVYYNGGVGSTLYTCEYNYTGTGTVDVEAYGWDGTQGKGVRIFDLWLTSSGGSSSSESSSSSSESSSSSSESSSSSSESSSSSSESSSSSSESSSSASSITPSWTAAACDIFGTTGNVPSGSVTTATETQVVFAATGGNVNSSNRRFYFVYTPVTGDFTFTARVVSVTGSFTVANNAYRYGLLFCENDLSVKTAYTDVRRFAENGFYTLTTTPTFQGSRAYKLDVGSGSTQSRTNTVANVGDYLRLVRSGNSVSCYYSTDGVNFTLLNTSSFANANGNPISDTMYVGFFAAPGADNLTFAYDNIVITQP